MKPVILVIFPVFAGMIPTMRTGQTTHTNFPRIRGDDPLIAGEAVA